MITLVAVVVHLQSHKGTAACGEPAKLEDITADASKVNCPRCVGVDAAARRVRRVLAS